MWFGSWPSLQGFRQGSSFSPLQLLAASSLPFRHKLTHKYAGSDGLDSLRSLKSGMPNEYWYTGGINISENSHTQDMYGCVGDRVFC